MKKHFKKIWNLRSLVFLLSGLVVLELAILFLPQIRPTVAKSLAEYANLVVAECSAENYRPACYDREIPKLMDYISMEDAFRVTRLVQDLDRTYTYCHVLGHELSAREVRKNPEAWKDVITRSPSGMCSNGGIHGAFQERFRAEYLSPAELDSVKGEFMDICEKRGSWSPTGLEQASCYHAVGHLTMYVTNADITKSLSLCDEIAIKPGGQNWAHLCYDGVFMQIYQPLEPEDFALIEGKEVAKDELESFCGQFTGQQKGSCWSEGWPLYRSELQKPEGLTAYCNKADESERDRCYEGLIYVMTAQFNLNPDRILPYCAGLVGDKRGQCLASAASRMIETDYRNMAGAVALCEAGQDFDPGRGCLEKLLMYTSYNYHPQSDEFYQACNSLPAGWKERCLK